MPTTSTTSTVKPLRLMRATLYTHNGRVVRTITISDDKSSATVRHHDESPYTVATSELGRADEAARAAYLTPLEA